MRQRGCHASDSKVATRKGNRRNRWLQRGSACAAGPTPGDRAGKRPVPQLAQFSSRHRIFVDALSSAPGCGSGRAAQPRSSIGFALWFSAPAACGRVRTRPRSQRLRRPSSLVLCCDVRIRRAHSAMPRAPSVCGFFLKALLSWVAAHASLRVVPRHPCSRPPALGRLFGGQRGRHDALTERLLSTRSHGQCTLRLAVLTCANPRLGEL